VFNDPVHRGQLYLRRAGQLLRNPAPDETTRIDGLSEPELERYFDGGRQQLSWLAARIEAATGCTLEGRRALDYGCGVGRMALPLAERCAHVYGLDVSAAVLRQADSNARRMNLANVQWLEADRLAELDGEYDLVISQFVFQHIPSREGERIFATLVKGLRPGGVAAIHVTLRPSLPLAGVSRPERRSVSAGPVKASFLHSLRSYPYMAIHSYSLNRLGRKLADEGIDEWNVKWRETIAGGRSFENATLIFRKD
jgi:SAM-dependent methyltransferase